jgi:hypothetical protein
LGHGPGLYVLVGQGEREHLYCEGCGAVRTLEPPQLDPLRDMISALFGYQVRFTHFPIVGLCPRCAAKQPGDHASGAREHDADNAHRHAHGADPPSAVHSEEHEHQHSHGDHVHSHPHEH